MSSDNEKSYDKIAESFISARKEAKANELVVRFSELIPPGSDILDVGCGAAIPNAKYLSEKGFRITGIDISHKLLEEAQTNVPGGEFIKTDIAGYETNKKFAGIVAWDSLFHLKREEHEAVFQKLYDLLESNGYLLFTHGGSEGEIQSEMFGEKFTYSSPGPDKIKVILENLGFKVVEWIVDLSASEGYLIALVRK